MTEEDRRAYHREYYRANAERKREYARQYRKDHPDRVRESKNRSTRKNPQPNRDRARKWRLENPERYNARQAQNKQRLRQEGYKDPQIRLRDQVIAEHWQAQGGRCYLGGEPLALENAILEHDHRCCPNAKFCSRCVRGAACQWCNCAVGYAKDDPARLRRIADALEAAQAAVDQRMAGAAVQEMLFAV